VASTASLLLPFFKKRPVLGEEKRCGCGVVVGKKTKKATVSSKKK
jgi:hypothetical protein